MKKLLCFPIALSLAALAVFPAAALAGPMRLDRSFGTNGRVSIPRSGFQESGLIAEAADGDTIVVEDQALGAYLPSGLRDTEFGESGATPLSTGAGRAFQASDLAVDSQGRIVVFGTSRSLGGSAGTATYMGGTVRPSLAAVLRYTPQGAPDPTFGKDGAVLSDLGLAHSNFNSEPVSLAGVGFVDAQDRPTFAAGRIEYVGCFRSAASERERALVRLQPNGSFDPSFGGGDGVEPIEGIETIVALGPRTGERIVGAALPADPCQKGPAGMVFTLDAGGAPAADFARGDGGSSPASNRRHWRSTRSTASCCSTGRLLMMGPSPAWSASIHSAASIEASESGGRSR